MAGPDAVRGGSGAYGCDCVITFTITLHGPFHIATGVAADGIDTPIDLSCPLPATSLKGLMRAEAVERLHVRQEYVDEIFGRSTTDPDGDPQRSAPGAWQWSDASFEKVIPAPYARISVDERGLTKQGFLAFGTQAWATDGWFSVEPRVRLDDVVRTRHTVILRACARSVSTLGGDRRRGSGWISISDAPWSAADTAVLRQLLRGRS